MYTKDTIKDRSQDKSYSKGQDKGLNLFKFTPENMDKVQMHMAKYPAGRQASAILPLLHLAQQQNGGWLSVAALEEIAHILNMSYIRVYEVVTFYKMFFFAPTGKYNFQLCGTTPCMLRGAAQLKEACQKKLKINTGEVSGDGLFSLVEVECVGACIQAPVIQINNDLFENLTTAQMETIIDDLTQGESLKSIFDRYAALPPLPSSAVVREKTPSTEEALPKKRTRVVKKEEKTEEKIVAPEKATSKTPSKAAPKKKAPQDSPKES